MFLHGNYWDDSEGRSYGQLVIGSFITTMHHHASRLVQRFSLKHQITQVTQPTYRADLAPCNFWLFPKLKSPLKGKRFQTVDEIQENRMGQLMATGRIVRSQDAYFEGDGGIIFLCTVFLVSCIFFSICLHFS